MKERVIFSLIPTAGTNNSFYESKDYNICIINISKPRKGSIQHHAIIISFKTIQFPVTACSKLDGIWLSEVGLSCTLDGIKR